MTKLCSACKTEQPHNQLAPKRSKESGFFGAKCWGCYLEHKKPGNLVASKRWYQENATPEFLARETRRHLAWQKTNPGKVNAITSKRRQAQACRIPPWADLAKIEAIYVEAACNNLEVDHIVPLQGKFVSGLHVHNNLQLLSRTANAAKGNKWD